MSNYVVYPARPYQPDLNISNISYGITSKTEQKYVALALGPRFGPSGVRPRLLCSFTPKVLSDAQGLSSDLRGVLLSVEII